MKRIVFVAPSQPSRTPRLVRNAAALAEAGYRVTVVTPLFEPSYCKYDEELVASASWEYVPVPLLDSNGVIRGTYRVQKRAAAIAARFVPGTGIAGASLLYGSRRLRKVLQSLQADFYFGQQQATFAVIDEVASAAGRPFGVDVEDLLSESPGEPAAVIQRIERATLARASLTCTMSHAAAVHIQKTHQLATPVLALHNCPTLNERDGIQRPDSARSNPSVYWFGQTLGPHSLGRELIEANAAAGAKFRVVLRGQIRSDYAEHLHETARSLGVEDKLEILPITSPQRMVTEAALHDVLFASQPSTSLFHQLAIGNKLFTGALAGCAILASDTVAHRALQAGMQGGMTLVDHTRPDQFSDQLSTLALRSEALLSMRRAAWDAATSVFNWDVESRKLQSAVARKLAQ